MVLDNASASTEPAFTPDLPASDIDPYAGDTNPTYASTRPSNYVAVNDPPNQCYVNLADLPRKFSLTGSTRPHPPAVINGIRDNVHAASHVLQRPVTQDEANAFAFHLAKAVRIGSLGLPVGCAMGFLLAWRGQRTWRFPGWTPFKKEGRLSPDRFGPLRNRQARFTWHFLRYNAYAFCSVIASQIFFGSYALSVSLAGRAMDPRLKDFNQTLQQRAQAGLGRRANGGRVEDESPGARGGETYDMARQRRGVQGSLAGSGRRKQDEMDGHDASPTGGAFGEEYMDTAGADGFMSEEEVRRQADARVRASREDTPFSAYSTDDRPSQTQSTRASRDPPSSQSSGGSAWDRLRQDAMSGNSSSSGGGGQNRSFRGTAPSSSAGARAPAAGAENAPFNDSFSFSSSDEERQLAKSEAQKDFDKRLDQERAGRDFHERGGGGKRW